MTLQDLGYSSKLEEYRKKQGLDAFGLGRVIKAHKERYIVSTGASELECELIGKLRYTVEDPNEWPAVGDWVAINEYDTHKALIHAVLPRSSQLERKAIGRDGEAQIIATNIDFGLILQSLNRDFNLNRLERYLTICHHSGIEPLVVFTKIDLLSEPELSALLTLVKQRIKSTPILAISNLSQEGLDNLRAVLKPGKTYCLLGSSGVGKSTLINVLSGTSTMLTGEISESIARGKHVTTHRELIVLEQGILIDNPGMREVGITDGHQGLELTFQDLMVLAESCKYSDCSHRHEDGCAVMQAVEDGRLSPETYEHYLSLEKEREHYESSALDKKKKDKDLGKLIKNMKRSHRKY